ncbi:MAG TPA: hypothetical protein VIQ98_08910, partial [Gemmatimonadales bacterium]
TPDGGEPKKSGDIVELLQATNPGNVTKAGDSYQKIAQACSASAEVLHQQSGRIAENLGGETAPKVLEALDKLHDSLITLAGTAGLIGSIAVWYGEEVLPWFRDNVPRVGNYSIDDTVDNVLGGVSNAHALAVYHLQQFNGFMGEAYDHMPETLDLKLPKPLDTASSFLPLPVPGGNGSQPLTQLAGLNSHFPGSSPFGGPDLAAGSPDPGLGVPTFSGPPSLPSAGQPGDPPAGLPTTGADLPGPGQGLPNVPQTPTVPDLGGAASAPDLGLPSAGQPATGLGQTPSFADPTLTDPTKLADFTGPGNPPPFTNVSTGNTGGLGGPLPTPTPISGQAVGAGSAIGAGGGVGAALRAPGAGGMPMGMIPPMMGGMPQQEQQQDRLKSLMEDEEDDVYGTNEGGSPARIE